MDLAVEMEALGFDALWLGGSPPSDVPIAEPVLAATERLVVGTSIFNIWTAAAEEVAGSFHRLDQASGGRFMVGLGIGHSERIDEYRSPFQALNQ